MVTEPFVALTSNSVKSIPIAPPDIVSEKLMTPAPESTTTFPVVDPPTVKVWPFVVARLPSPVRYVAMLPEFADIEAVGVPLFMFNNPILALAVAVEPSNKSTTPV